jgi:hypothetical protein
MKPDRLARLGAQFFKAWWGDGRATMPTPGEVMAAAKKLGLAEWRDGRTELSDLGLQLFSLGAQVTTVTWRAQCGVCYSSWVGESEECPSESGTFCPNCRDKGLMAPGVLNWVSDAQDVPEPRTKRSNVTKLEKLERQRP